MCPIKRKSDRKDFSGDAKIRLLSEDKEFSVTIKDISSSGIKVIITRIVDINTPVEVKMCINERNIHCNGRVAWSLPLRPAFGDILVFDTGIELTDIKPDDSEFLRKACIN